MMKGWSAHICICVSLADVCAYLVCVWSSQRLAVDQDSSPPPLLLGQAETSTPPAEAAPLYR